MLDLMRNLKTIDAAYVAGLLDGDGSFNIIRKTDNPFSAQFRTPIRLYNTDTRVLYWMSGMFGGIVHDGYWELLKKSSQQILLRAILPYQRVKHVETELLLAIYVLQDGRKSKDAVHLSTIKNTLQEQMRWLHHNRNTHSITTPAHSDIIMSPETFAYLAGIVDTDGSIQVCKNHASMSYRLAVSNTSLLLMDWLVTTFGGLYYPGNKVESMCYNWNLNKQQELLYVLQRIRPYLKVKWEQADVVTTLLTASRTETKRLELS